MVRPIFKIHVAALTDTFGLLLSEAVKASDLETIGFSLVGNRALISLSRPLDYVHPISFSPVGAFRIV